MPSGSVELEALKLTSAPIGAGFGEAVKDAKGGEFPGGPLVTTRDLVAMSVAPPLSVTRRPIVRVPALA